MTDHKHTDQDEAHELRLLDELKWGRIANGEYEEDIELERHILRNEGRTAGEIAARELAELRLFTDMRDDSAAVAAAAFAGTPSEVTLALAERAGYCPGCVRHWFGVFASRFRHNRAIER